MCHPADADNYENDDDLLFTASSIQNVEILFKNDNDKEITKYIQLSKSIVFVRL